MSRRWLGWGNYVVSTTQDTPIRAFLSYARADDEEFGFVDPLVSKLKALVRAKSGRTLEVFVDRESIGWGESWRDRLTESIEGATVLIPLMSATYLERDACREELLTFHANATVLGVTDLILPILVFRSSLFHEGNPDEVVQIAMELQHKCIEDALFEGVSSPLWLQCTRDLADSLLAAVAKAEAILGSPGAPTAAPAAEVESDSADEPQGLAELMADLNEAIEDMTALADELAPAMEALGVAAGSVGPLPDQPSPKQVRLWAIRVAEAFKVPSQNIEAHGRKLFDGTRRLDQALVGLDRLATEIGVPELEASIRDGVASVVTNLGDLRDVVGNLDELLTSMRPAEALSVPVRKSLQPARRGLTAIRDSVQLITTWGDLYT